MVWDSGDDIEQITSRLLPNFFNVSRDNVTRKNRSDDKGPEPEGVVVGRVGDSTYIFAGLERTSGVMVYNATNPVSPRFSQFITTRDYSRAIAGDVSTEALLFIPPAQNRLNTPLVIAAYEVSGTVAVFAFDTPQPAPRLAAADIDIRTSYLNSTQILVDIPTNGAESITVNVTDIRGRTLENTVLTGTQAQERLAHTVRFDGQQPGAYILTVGLNGRQYSQTVMVGR